MVNRLFHISEEGNIREFIPRESIKQWEHKEYVWALHEEKLHNYLLPRDCPRVCVSLNATNPIHLLKIDSATTFKAVVFVSEEWHSRIINCKLYRYEFNTNNFKLIDENAGYYVSEEVEIPIDKITIENCVKAIRESNVMLQFVEHKKLASIRDIVIKNMKIFSIIRWRNFKE